MNYCMFFDLFRKMLVWTIRLLMIFSIFYGGECIRNTTYIKNDELFHEFSNKIIFPMEGKRKGEAGKIAVVGGSTEYTGAPYFAAISSLKAGADLVFIFTTTTAAPVVKSYSPDIIVYPFLGHQNLMELELLIPKMDLVIIGPGLGRANGTLSLVYIIMQYCKNYRKPLVIDADGLYAISKNTSILNSYPSPGVILTPNFHEAELLKKSMNGDKHWHKQFGPHVSVLLKGKEDHYVAPDPMYEWTISDGGSSRRAAGQGDILAGILGTFFNWAIKVSANDEQLNYLKAVSTYAAAKFTRTCNSNSFVKYGRSMVASDMINEISFTFIHLLI